MTLITHHINVAFLAFLLFVGVFPTGSIAAEDHNLRRVEARKRDSLPLHPFGTGTPDDLPPALENVCDQYDGKAKRLCVKFCEAKDCDDYDESDAPRGCASIKANFQKITGKYSLPCEDRCPCWEESELDSGEICEPDDAIVSVQTTTQTPPAVFGVIALQGFFCGAKIGSIEHASVLFIAEEEYEVCKQQIIDKCGELETST